MFDRIPANVLGVGIPWYKRSDYRRILEVMVDRETLPRTFDKWQSRAEHVERELRRAGRTPMRAALDPEQFVAWCAARGLDVDGSARSLFAADPANWDVGHKH